MARAERYADPELARRFVVALGAADALGVDLERIDPRGDEVASRAAA